MKDKFHVNFLIASPAAILAILIITAISFATEAKTVAESPYNLVQLIPYVLVLVLALTGINVFTVLLVGIVAASVIMVCFGPLDMIGLLQNIGNGISGMYETILVALAERNDQRTKNDDNNNRRKAKAIILHRLNHIRKNELRRECA